MKRSFLIYNDLEPVVDAMSNEQAGMLLKSVFDYATRGEVKGTGDQGVDLVLLMVRATLDRQMESYSNVCERNKKNGARGGRPKSIGGEPKKPSGFSGNPNIPSEPKKADSDSGSDLREREVASAPPPQGSLLGKLSPKEMSKTRGIIPPKIEWVRQYFEDNAINISPERFVNANAAVGWTRGKTKIKDWQATARTWAENAKGQAEAPRQTAAQLSKEDQERELALLQKRVRGEVGIVNTKEST